MIVSKTFPAIGGFFYESEIAQAILLYEGVTSKIQGVAFHIPNYAQDEIFQKLAELTIAKV